jgi:hypothetical protein
MEELSAPDSGSANQVKENLLSFYKNEVKKQHSIRKQYLKLMSSNKF